MLCANPLFLELLPIINTAQWNSKNIYQRGNRVTISIIPTKLLLRHVFIKRAVLLLQQAQCCGDFCDTDKARLKF